MIGKIGSCFYQIHRAHARKLWVPRDGLRWPPPRLVQLIQELVCQLDGHNWSEWCIDDMDGPMIIDEHGAYPALSRMSMPGEFGTRVCRRLCGTVERRMPIESD